MPFSTTISLSYPDKTTAFYCVILIYIRLHFSEGWVLWKAMYHLANIPWNTDTGSAHSSVFLPVFKKLENFHGIFLGTLFVFHHADLLPLIPATE